jgi:hypothetical protein
MITRKKCRLNTKGNQNYTAFEGIHEKLKKETGRIDREGGRKDETETILRSKHGANNLSLQTRSRRNRIRNYRDKTKPINVLNRGTKRLLIEMKPLSAVHWQTK